MRGGRTWGQASKTFRIERVGDKRLPLFQHVAERCLEFRPEVKVISTVEITHAVPNENCVTVAPGQLKAGKDAVVLTDTIEPPELLQPTPIERGSLAEKEWEGLTMPADLESPRVCEARCNEQLQHITHAETVLEPDPSDISALRKLGAAVLVRAFEDARTDSRARQWFEATPQPMLTFWCQVVGLDCERVRKQARKMAATRHCL